MANPIQFTMVNAVPLYFGMAFCATNVENKGESAITTIPQKIKKLSKIQDERNLNFDIEIDGGINFENCKKAIDAGANILVSGTTIFKSNNGDIKKNINLLKLK